MISAVDLLNGIGVYAGLKVINVKGATGYIDTNYEGKARAALDALKFMELFLFIWKRPMKWDTKETRKVKSRPLKRLMRK